MKPAQSLYEILVPTVRPDGRPIRTRHHRVWDSKIRAVSNGLTILEPVKGQWISPVGELFAARMIPVRILATRAQIEQIVDLTLTYYDQQAVLAYAISNEIILKYRNQIIAS